MDGVVHEECFEGISVKENLAHTLNEYIEIHQLIKATECYYGVIEALLE